MQSLLVGTPSAWQIWQLWRVLPATVVVAALWIAARSWLTWQFVAKHEALAGFVAWLASMLACCGAELPLVWQPPCAHRSLFQEGVSEFFGSGWQLLQKAASEALYEDEVVLRCSTPSSRLWHQSHDTS